MADTDRSAIDTFRAQLLRWLAADAGLDPDEVVTGAVLVFCTERLRRDGKIDHNDGRAYPVTGISPTLELGLINKAWRDIHRGK